ncbi:MAG: trigger factor, partial [Pseudomonadota bacterium]|nr:trigger factor [Pseudomonadota bacterium]
TVDFILEMANVTEVQTDVETLYAAPEEGESAAAAKKKPAKKAAAKKAAAKKAAPKKAAAKKGAAKKAAKKKS